MSIHPEILELIHLDIDGVATESEQVTLREAIARDPAVRDEYRRLRGLSEILARVPREEPESDLVPNVLRRVRARRSAAEEGFLHRLRGAWPGGHVGVAVGVGLATCKAVG